MKKKSLLRKLALKYTDLIDPTKYRLELKRRDGVVIYSTTLNEAVLMAALRGGRLTLDIPSSPSDEYVLNILEVE